MAYALVVSTVKASTGTTSVTTDAVDTTGANLIVVAVHNYTVATVAPTDSKGNVWSALTRRTSSGSDSVQLYYCLSPTVGTGHTFSFSESGRYPTLTVSAWSVRRPRRCLMWRQEQHWERLVHRWPRAA